MRRFGLMLLGTLATTLVIGCDRGMVQIEGTVKVDGKPAEKGTLVFFCPLGDTRPAEGVVQEDGSFVMKTSREPGVMRGEYKVTITNSVNSIVMPKDLDPQNPNDPRWQDFQKKLDELQTRPAAPGMLPSSYANINTTPLTWKVPDSGKRADFDIPSGAAPGAQKK